MKLIRLLLIGLLSTVSFLACDDEKPTPPEIPPKSITVDVPVIYSGAPTELTAKGVYENTALNKTLTTEPTWTIVPIAPSETSDFTLVENILTANTINTTVKITATYLTISDNKSVTVSSSTVSSINITPSNATIVARLTDIQLKATATYTDGVNLADDKIVDITGVANWTINTGSSTMTVNNVDNKGLVSATSKTVPTNITASFHEKSATASVTALATESKITGVKITPTDFTLDNKSTQQLTATASYNPEGSIDVTNLATWTSADPTIATVENITNKGLVTAKADSGSSVITVIYGITNDKITVTAKPAPIFNSFAITGTDGNTVKIGETNQLQTTETIDGIEATIKHIDSSDYVCTVEPTVTAVTISGNCIITGVEEILSVDILITNEKAVTETKTIQFAVTLF